MAEQKKETNPALTTLIISNLETAPNDCFESNISNLTKLPNLDKVEDIRPSLTRITLPNLSEESGNNIMESLKPIDIRNIEPEVLENFEQALKAMRENNSR